MSRQRHPQYVLHLEALPRGNDDSGMLRLRALLKVLLRSFGFRCLNIERPEPRDGDAQETAK